MNDLLTSAKDDLARLEAAMEKARVSYEAASAAYEEHLGFVNKLELYANGVSLLTNVAARAVAYASGPPVVDGLQRKMALTIPREGTKRFEIGNAAMGAFLLHGPLSTADLLPHIPAELFEGSSNPKNYLSNALSKDARIIATPKGWDIRSSPPHDNDVGGDLKGA